MERHCSHPAVDPGCLIGAPCVCNVYVSHCTALYCNTSTAPWVCNESLPHCTAIRALPPKFAGRNGALGRKQAVDSRSGHLIAGSPPGKCNAKTRGAVTSLCSTPSLRGRYSKPALQHWRELVLLRWQIWMRRLPMPLNRLPCIWAWLCCWQQASPPELRLHLGCLQRQKLLLGYQLQPCRARGREAAIRQASAGRRRRKLCTPVFHSRQHNTTSHICLPLQCHPEPPHTNTPGRLPAHPPARPPAHPPPPPAWRNLCTSPGAPACAAPSCLAASAGRWAAPRGLRGGRHRSPADPPSTAGPARGRRRQQLCKRPRLAPALGRCGCNSCSFGASEGVAGAGWPPASRLEPRTASRALAGGIRRQRRRRRRRRRRLVAAARITQEAVQLRKHHSLSSKHHAAWCPP